MCTSWSSANQISNFKFSTFFRVLFALWSLKYPHPKSQQTPQVSTELEMVVNLSYSSIPLQKISQKGVDRSVENPQKRAENIKMAPNAPNKFSWRMRNKMPLCSIGVVIKTIGSYVSMLHISMNARWRMNQLLINGIEIEFLTASKAQVPLYTNALNHSMTKQMFCWIVSHAICSLKF